MAISIIHPFHIETEDGSDLHPFWNLNEAIQMAWSTEAVGRHVVRVTQAHTGILEEDELRQAIAAVRTEFRDG